MGGRTQPKRNGACVPVLGISNDVSKTNFDEKRTSPIKRRPASPHRGSSFVQRQSTAVIPYKEYCYDGKHTEMVQTPSRIWISNASRILSAGHILDHFRRLGTI